MKWIRTWRDPYGLGFSTTGPKKVCFEPGLTVLVGCNGSGKSTLLRNVRDELEKEGVPCLLYDDRQSGSSVSAERKMFYGDVEGAVRMMTSSEGEKIRLGIGDQASSMREFILYGRKQRSRLEDALAAAGGHEIREKDHGDERWVLMDAVDSGYSVDNVLELKSFFGLMSKDATDNGKTLYIVVSANEYELAASERCMDVMAGKEVFFKDYAEYREFILKTRKKKEKRMERALARKDKKEKKGGA